MAQNEGVLRTVLIKSICFSLLLLAAACGEQDSSAPASLDHLTQSLDTLRVIIELGQEVGDSTSTFSSIVSSTIDENHRILVLDEMEACIKVFDLDGNFIQQVSRRGSGPGELISPGGLFLGPENSVGVIDMNTHGLVVFDDSLNYLEDIRHWNQDTPYHVSTLSETRIVVCELRQEEGDENFIMRRLISIYGWDTEEQPILLWQDSLVESESDFIQSPSATFRYVFYDKLCTSGSSEFGVFFAPSDPDVYSVTGWDSTGAVILQINREMIPVEKSEEEYDAETFYIASEMQRSSGRPLPFAYYPERYRDMIADKGIGPDSLLWVRRWTYTELFFDIYDLNGNLLRQAIYPQSSFSWQTEITPRGIVAWESDPLEGYQKLYLIGE